MDWETIRTRINKLKDRFNIAGLAIDPWNATQHSFQLQGDGFEVVIFGQGFMDMTSPSKELGTLVMSGKPCHAGHSFMRCMASNVAAEVDAAGNLKPSKKKSTERIDGYDHGPVPRPARRRRVRGGRLCGGMGLTNPLQVTCQPSAC